MPPSFEVFAMQRFLSKAEVRHLVKLSHTEIARREARGEFPKRIPLGAHRTSRRVYLESEILAWILAQVQRARPE